MQLIGWIAFWALLIAGCVYVLTEKPGDLPDGDDMEGEPR